MLQSVAFVLEVGAAFAHQHSLPYSVPAYLYPKLLASGCTLIRVLVLVEPAEYARARGLPSMKQPY